MKQTFQVLLRNRRFEVIQDQNNGTVHTVLSFKTQLPEYVFYKKVVPKGVCQYRPLTQITLLKEKIQHIVESYIRTHVKIVVTANTLHPSGHHRLTRNTFKKRFPNDSAFVDGALHGSLRITVSLEGMLTEGAKKQLSAMVAEIFKTIQDIKK